MDAPKINRRGPVPPYLQIAAWLRSQAAAGAYPEDVPLPPEKELAEALDVSRDAVRHALAVLRDEGLVYTVPARGTYVTDKGRQARP
jgi:GntR family transcriptional regulator